MPSYITELNAMISEASSRVPGLIQMGENINKGSCLCGMTKKLPGDVRNIGNCENTHCGVGFGIMLNGGRAVLFMKQLDFVLLGLDQLTNTFNFIKTMPAGQVTGSFTIVVIVCDHGMQGPQSSFNDLSGICSLAHVNGYSLTNRREAEYVLATQLGQPGFRIIALSQRLFGGELLDLEIINKTNDGALFQYSQGDDATIVCFQFSLPQGLELQRQFATQGKEASIFSAHAVAPAGWELVFDNACRTGLLIALDDGKGRNSLSDKLLAQARSFAPNARTHSLTRDTMETCVSSDQFRVDVESGTHEFDRKTLVRR